MRIIQVFKKPISILVIFIAFKLIQTIYSFVIHETPTYMSQIRLIEFVVFTILSFYAIKGKKIAAWTIGTYLIIHVFAVLRAIFMIS